MRKIFLSFLSVGMLSGAVMAQDAFVQIVHNSPTPAAATVDIYLYDGANWIPTAAVENLNFREATGFIALPAGAPGLRVAVAPRTGTPSIADTLASFAVPSLLPNGTYYAIAGGEVGSSFDIFYGEADTLAASVTNFSLQVFHGSPDAPAVNVYSNLDAFNAVVDNKMFGEFNGVAEVPANDLFLLITKGGQIDTLIEGFSAPLSTLGLGGAGGLVVASGKLNPGVGEAGFGLFAVLPSGGSFVALPQTDLSRSQIMHNAPDPLASVVDIYVTFNGTTTKLDDVAFRTATSAGITPSGNYRIHVAPSTSTDTTQAIATVPLTLMKNRTYALVAYGLVDIAAPRFANAVAVNGNAVAFNLDVNDQARFASGNPGVLSAMVYHQSPDAPTVDAVSEATSITIVDDISYGERQGYFPFPAIGSTILQITPGNDNSTIVGRYQVPLGALAGQVVNVFASGLLTPNDENVNGAPGFGLWAVTPAGGAFIQLSDLTSVQENANGVGVSVYPNPAVEFVNVSIKSEINSTVVIRMFDMSGKMVQSVNSYNLVNGNNVVPFNVAGLNSGVYTIQVMGDGIQSTVKFVK